MIPPLSLLFSLFFGKAHPWAKDRRKHRRYRTLTFIPGRRCFEKGKVPLHATQHSTRSCPPPNGGREN